MRPATATAARASPCGHAATTGGGTRACKAHPRLATRVEVPVLCLRVPPSRGVPLAHRPTRGAGCIPVAGINVASDCSRGGHDVLRVLVGASIQRAAAEPWHR